MPPSSPTAVRLRHPWRAALVTSVLGAIGCGSGYPGDWPPLPSRLLATFGRDCPDLAGTWRVEFVREFSQSAIARAIGPRRPRFNWETMTIAGDARDSLRITTRRSDSLRTTARRWAQEQGDPAEYEAAKLRDPIVRWKEGAFLEMTDAEYAANIETLILAGERTFVLRPGTDYSCSDGQLVSARLLRGWYRDENGNPRDTVIGVVRTGRNTAGELVFEARYREAVKFTLWAETGAGIPLGTWTMHDWSRLKAAEPPIVTPEPRPWARPFVHPWPSGSATDDRISAMSPAEIDAIARPLAPPGLTLSPVERAGRAFRVVAAAPTTDAFVKLFIGLRKSQRFTMLQVARLSGDAGAWEMDIRVQPGPRPSTMSAAELRDRVVALLGTEVRVDSVRAAHGGASLYLICRGRGAWQRAIATLGRTRTLRLDTYMFDRLDPGDVSRGWVHVSERVELYAGANLPR